ncbi:acylphosphatase-1-like [Harmonia axyridis]|uniref:acylphosphatase-1-like n=1 Tax=Harmonia axyridis TaxID=115357 RepID=UPI001E279B88|nr:acylphosphatase-1-like [Harmonia axyridis]
MASSSRLISVDFEVFGHVQGVFFRKHTQKEAQTLNLKGYCMNTKRGTVKGILQGDMDKVNMMKVWLQKTGSPKSKIEKAEFRNEKQITSASFNDFSIKK